MKRKLPARVRPWFGVLLAVVAAVAAGTVFAGKDVRVAVPLWFAALLVVLAMRYGIAVGVLGSLISALIFAHMLFQPFGDWRIENPAARQNLAWMILGSVVLSYLFGPSSRAPNDREK